MTRHLALILATALTVAAAACSSGPADGASAAGGGAAATTAPTAPVHDGRPIHITANDKMKFDVTEITAAPGERLSVTLTNVGTTPKLSMGHNWILLVPGTELVSFAVAAAEAAATDFVPQGDARMLAATRLLGPGESDTVTFNAPATPGRYEFICSFPGHYQVGMRGVLIVG
ncbi:MAG: plastocyanin/azurin family copper-binding protein [Vicinamibacterales bacterium]